MVYQEGSKLIISMYGYDPTDIPHFIAALTDAIKYIDEDHFESIKQTNMLYYLGVLIENMTPEESQLDIKAFNKPIE